MYIYVEHDVINKIMENQEYCTALFLDLSQPFDKVWHPALLFKIKIITLKLFQPAEIVSK